MNQEKIKELEQLICSDYSNITGLVVQKKGLKLYEKYFHGFGAEDGVHIFSVTKSIFSALIGIAIEKGYIKGVNQRILDFFPEYCIPAGETAIQEITVEHLLTMTASYKCDTEPYEEFFTSGNWVDFALGLLGGKEPSEEFRYSPIVGTHILSGILENAVGMSILDFAVQHLFSPLGIPVNHNIVFRDKEEQLAFYGIERHTRGWVADPQGRNTASWGLTLTPLDMVKIGQLYLNGGVWNGKQMISPDWIRECTRIHSRWGEMAYGYLWWVMSEEHGIYAAMGDGGNAIYINTEKEMVVSIGALLKPEIKDSIDFIIGQVEPLFAEF